MFDAASFQQQKLKEKIVDEKIRKMMLKNNITYHQAKELVEKGQSSLGDF